LGKGIGPLTGILLGELNKGFKEVRRPYSSSGKKADRLRTRKGGGKREELRFKRRKRGEGQEETRRIGKTGIRSWHRKLRPGWEEGGFQPGVRNQKEFIGVPRKRGLETEIPTKKDWVD